MMKRPMTEKKKEPPRRFLATKMAYKCPTNTHQVWDLSGAVPRIIHTEDKTPSSLKYDIDNMHELAEAWQNEGQVATSIGVVDWSKEKYYIKAYNLTSEEFVKGWLPTFIKCGEVQPETWTTWMKQVRFDPTSSVEEEEEEIMPLMAVAVPPMPPPPPPPPPPMAPPLPPLPSVLFYTYRHPMESKEYVRDNGAYTAFPTIDWKAYPIDAAIVATVDRDKNRAILMHYRVRHTAPDWTAILPVTQPSPPLSLSLVDIEKIRFA